MDDISEHPDETVESLLDWHYRADAGLSRLRQRLRSEGKRPIGLHRFARRFAAVAALLLVTWALVGGLAPVQDPASVPSFDIVAFLQPDTGQREHAVVKAFPQEMVPARGVDHAALKPFVLDPRSRSQRLTEDGRLPVGPRVDRLLEVRNRGRRSLELKVGGERTELRLDLRGPGTNTLTGGSVANGQLPPFLAERPIPLEPGASYFLPIPYLIGGRRGQLQGVYWTKPGLYRLSVRYRVGAQDGTGERDLLVESPPIWIEVLPPP